MARSKKKGKMILKSIITNTNIKQYLNSDSSDKSSFGINDIHTIIYVNFDQSGKLVIESIETVYGSMGENPTQLEGY